MAPHHDPVADPKSAFVDTAASLESALAVVHRTVADTLAALGAQEDAYAARDLARLEAASDRLEVLGADLARAERARAEAQAGRTLAEALAHLDPAPRTRAATLADALGRDVADLHERAGRVRAALEQEAAVAGHLVALLVRPLEPEAPTYGGRQRRVPAGALRVDRRA